MSDITTDLAELKSSTKQLSEQFGQVVEMVQNMSPPEATIINVSAGDFVSSFTIFILACFVGYYVVWRVTPALHTPLMSVTNAISAIVIIGGVLAAGSGLANLSSSFGLFAVFLASINIFGGFIVTQRMLAMFSKKR